MSITHFIYFVRRELLIVFLIIKAGSLYDKGMEAMNELWAKTALSIADDSQFD